MGWAMSNLITQSEFSRKLKISRQAVHDAKKKGLLNIEKKGKREYINLDGYKTIRYIKNDNCQRKEKKQKIEVDLKNLTINTQLPANIAKGLQQGDTIRLIFEKARAEEKIAKAEKARLENAYKRGELIIKEKVYNTIMYYLDRVNRGMELIGNTFLNDTGDAIVTAGKVTPEIRKRFVDMMLKHIDSAKKQTIKYIKKIEKEQAK